MNLAAPSGISAASAQEPVDIGLDPDYRTIRGALHLVQRAVPLRLGMRAFRLYVESYRARRGLSYGFDPARRAAQHPAHVKSAVEAVGGYGVVKQSLDAIFTHSIAMRMGSIAFGRRWFARCAEIASSVPPPGSIIVVPHIGVHFLHQAHLLVEGRSVFFPTFETANTFAGQFRMLSRYGSIAEGAVLRVVRLPDALPLFAVRARNALKQGMVVTWQPDAFFPAGEGAGPPVPLSPLLGLSVTPLVERLADLTGAPVYIAYNRLIAGGEKVRLYYDRVARQGERRGDFTRQLYDAIEKTILDNIDQWSQWHYSTML